MLGSVKIAKLCFGLAKATPEIRYKAEEVIRKYYENIVSTPKYGQLYCEVTPTKQIRPNYDGYNHNLQMIPLDQFGNFLRELIFAVGQDLSIYEIHLAKDILTKEDVASYLETLNTHEYLNGYVARTFEADSTGTVYIAKSKKLNSTRKQKLLIKFYDKATELIKDYEPNRVLPIKEPIASPDIPVDFVNGRDVILLYQMNLMRCEMELRENNLPYTTIGQVIEAIENASFQDVVEDKYTKILKDTVFTEPKEVSCKSLKELAVNLAHASNRDYKLLFSITGMGRKYNYFKIAKEVTTREDDLKFNELQMKLINN